MFPLLFLLGYNTVCLKFHNKGSRAWVSDKKQLLQSDKQPSFKYSKDNQRVENKSDS